MNKIVFIFCIIVFLFKTQTVFSNNLIYDVNNIEVRAKTNNDLGKRKLIRSAFQKAFIIFIDKTLLKDDAISLYKTKLDTIEDLVFAYQIVKEKKNNEKEIILSINIKFDSKKINDFFAENKVSYADVSNISLTLLPVFIKEKDIFIFSENFFYNNWLKVQNKIVNENKNDMLVTYNLALENIEDVQYISSIKENLELIDLKKLNSFSDAENYVFLIIYFLENNFKGYVKTFINGKEVDKNFNLKINSESKIKTYKQAIEKTKEEIDQIWKSQNLIDINTPSFLDLFLEIKKPSDYLYFLNIFRSINLIENYSVLEMTNKNVKIRLKYKGKINKLRDKLLVEKIRIKIEDNIWKAAIK
jgi:hypothetical protein